MGELWIRPHKREEHWNGAGTVSDVFSSNNNEIVFDLEDIKTQETHALTLKSPSPIDRNLIQKSQELTIRVRNGSCNVTEGVRTPTPPLRGISPPPGQSNSNSRNR